MTGILSKGKNEGILETVPGDARTGGALADGAITGDTLGEAAPGGPVTGNPYPGGRVTGNPLSSGPVSENSGPGELISERTALGAAWSERTRRLIGPEAFTRLGAHVAVFGLGGVGGHACETLARSGIARLTLVDGDVVAESNLNRQLVALRSTIGKPKAEVMAQRLRDIREDIEIHAHAAFYTPDALDLLPADADFVVDAIDDVPNKALLVAECLRRGIPVISSCGAGNRLDPMGFRVGRLSETKVDPLARAMRARLKKMGVDASRVTVVWSKETPCQAEAAADRAPGSIAFVPGAAGLLMASYVVCALSGARRGRDGV